MKRSFNQTIFIVLQYFISHYYLFFYYERKGEKREREIKRRNEKIRKIEKFNYRFVHTFTYYPNIKKK